MKSKYTTYILLAILCVIWGVITKKLFFNDTSNIVAVVPTNTLVVRISSDKDTVLRLDYRDPFIAVSPQNKPDIVTPDALNNLTYEHLDATFHGTIRTNGRSVCLVEYRNEQHLLRMGESLDGFRLCSISKDSLQFSRDNLTYTTLHLVQ